MMAPTTSIRLGTFAWWVVLVGGTLLLCAAAWRRRWKRPTLARSAFRA